MSGGISEYRTAPALWRQADGAQPQRQLLCSRAVVDMQIQVELLRVRGVRPARRCDLRVLKGEHREAAVVPRDQDPAL